MREVELAALPDGTGQDGAAGGLQPGMVVADDEADATHAAVDQAVEEGSPVDFGFRGIAGDAEHAPSPVRPDANSGEQGGIADHAAVAQLLVAGVEEEIVDLAQRPAAPGSEFLVQQSGSSADLGRRQALQAELGHHLGGIAGGDALHVHLGDRQHHRSRGSAPTFQRLRIERLVNSGGLGDVDGHRSCRGIDCLALVAVGMAAPIGVAFVQPGPEEALPLQAHSEIEQRREHLRHPLRAFGDELFHESGHDRILGLRHPVFLLDTRNNRFAVEPLLQPNFQTSGYTSRMTRQVEALIAGTHLAGTKARRVRRALAALFRGAVGKDAVSRIWRKVKTDWETWSKRPRGEEDVVRLILDGTVVRVRLDKKAASISLLIVLGVHRDGQKGLLAVKNMGGESVAAWRALLDDLIARGLKTP